MLPSHEFPGNYIYYISFVGLLAFLVYSVSIKVSVFARGKGDNRFDHLFERLTSLVPYLMGNARVARKRYWYSGVLHSLIYWGFIVLQIRTHQLHPQGLQRRHLLRAHLRVLTTTSPSARRWTCSTSSSSSAAPWRRGSGDSGSPPA